MRKLPRPAVNPDTPAARYSIDEAAQVLDLSRKTVYDHLRSGALPGVKLGRLWILPKAAFDQWLRTAGGKLA
jgi:excisionase family DNA binding protein